MVLSYVRKLERILSRFSAAVRFSALFAGNPRYFRFWHVAEAYINVGLARALNHLVMQLTSLAGLFFPLLPN